MRSEKINRVLVVIPNLNGGDELLDAIKSLTLQTLKPNILVVDNSSSDGSADRAKKHFPEIELIRNNTNLGYTGGVNPGFVQAINTNIDYVASFNNDAVADPLWLKELAKCLDENLDAAIAACKVLNGDGSRLDSAGEFYTTWGLSYPRGRGEPDTGQYDTETDLFAASGAASLYRVAALKEIGIFDQDFFAYYEDVDLSFRAQLAGWKVRYAPKARLYHHTGSTSSKIPGFTTYQTMKNEPILLFKNVPRKYLFHITSRLLLAHTLFLIKAFTRGHGWIALKGDLKGTGLLFKKAGERRKIQKHKKVTDEYIWGMLVHDLPPNANALRSLRRKLHIGK